MTPICAGKPAPRRPLLATPVTHSDWMVRENAPAWGPEGVREILDRCAEAGIARVYWRCFDGGRALYLSKYMGPAHIYDEDNYHVGKDSEWVVARLRQFDYGAFDTLAEALLYGREIGMQVHAWLSINEDDHAWGLISRFAGAHPEYRWVMRDGRRCHSQLSFAFPEVREYKLNLLREIMAYQPDGIFFDWIRTGDVRDNPHTDAAGYAIHGYEAPNLERFQADYGLDAHDAPNDDPRWVSLRAEPQTLFMREARRLIKEQDECCTISVMVHHPWGYRGTPDDTPYAGSREGLLCDVGQWAQEGLMEEAVAAGYYRPGGTQEGAYRWLADETAGRVGLWLYGWLNDEAWVRQELDAAERLGAMQLLLWESDYFIIPPDKVPVIKMMREFATGK